MLCFEHNFSIAAGGESFLTDSALPFGCNDLPASLSQYHLFADLLKYDPTSDLTPCDLPGDLIPYDLPGDLTPCDLTGDLTPYDLPGDLTPYGLPADLAGCLSASAAGVSRRVGPAAPAGLL